MIRKQVFQKVPKRSIVKKIIFNRYIVRPVKEVSLQPRRLITLSHQAVYLSGDLHFNGCPSDIYKPQQSRIKQLILFCCDFIKLLYESFLQVQIVFISGLLVCSMLGKSFSRWHFEIFILFFPENRLWHFIQIVSFGNNLHKMSEPIFWEKIRKK